MDAWRYGEQLADLSAAHQLELANMANANSAVVLEEQDKRFALEHWLAASDQARYRALSDEQTQQARLRDRLATADLRLSVLLDAIGSNGSGGVQATTGAGGVMVVSKRPIAGPQCIHSGLSEAAGSEVHAIT